MPTVHLIDASPYIFRAYYSIPPHIRAPDGFMTNAVHGYTEFLIQILKKEQPSHVAVAFDGSLTTSFRNKIYPPYKAQRALPPPELEMQLDLCREVTEAIGMTTFRDDQYEADDLIGTLANRLVKSAHKAVIISNDKDFAQLVTDRISFWDFARDERYDVEKVELKFGVRPDQFVDLLALMGDSVDNIPGVKGIGPKTAAAILGQFSNIEDIFKNLERVSTLTVRGAAALQERLSTHREMAELSKKLARISFAAPVSADLETLKYEGAIRSQVNPLFERLGFDQIKARIPKWQAGPQKQVDF